jgi:HPr kinase/phosphorylase
MNATKLCWIFSPDADIVPLLDFPAPARHRVPMTAQNFHATCVLLPEAKMAGILLTGPAGAGKSSLALQLLDTGGQLVCDDQTMITPALQGLVATAPEGLAGLIEIHGHGIVQLPAHKIAPAAVLALYVALVPASQPIERLPETTHQQVLATRIPRLTLRAHDPAAIAKIKAVLNYHLLDFTNV